MSWETRMDNLNTSVDYLIKLREFGVIIANHGYCGNDFKHMMNLYKSANGSGLIEKMFTIYDGDVLNHAKTSVNRVLGLNSVLATTFNRMYEDLDFRKSCISEYSRYITLLWDKK